MPLGYPNGPGASFVNSFANNSFSATSTVVSGSTSVLTGHVQFGFNAALVKAAMDVSNAYLNFQSTFLASTNDFKLSSGDAMQDFYCFGVGSAGMSWAATSTAALMRMGAWG